MNYQDHLNKVLEAANEFLQETKYSHDAALSDKENEKWESLYLSVEKTFIQSE